MIPKWNPNFSRPGCPRANLIAFMPTDSHASTQISVGVSPCMCVYLQISKCMYIYMYVYNYNYIFKYIWINLFIYTYIYTCFSIFVYEALWAQLQHRQYTQPGSSWRPAACSADVIAARPWVLLISSHGSMPSMPHLEHTAHAFHDEDHGKASQNKNTLLDLCVSSLRRGHANLLCIVPILTDDPRRESKLLSPRVPTS